jgi:3-hydroxy-9,10-secoandrosta-1,3,5(10)-triene-9,17-dione monooxygenase
MIPVLVDRVPELRALRRIPDQTIADLRQARFFDLLRPKAWNGLEIHPGTFFRVQTQVARGCPSTAWVMGVLSVHAWQLALFAPQAQQDVWGADPHALISSSYAPTGKIEPVEGGYRVSGKWSFSSGSDHCSWVFLGGLVPPREPHHKPQMRTFLLPRADYTIEDNWNVIGLEGTGSKNIIVSGAFVPEHRTHKFTDGFSGKSPGLKVNTAPLFKLPFGQVFVRSVSTSIIGVLEGALEAYIETARSRIAASNQKKVSLDPVSQMVCAHARATLDEINLVLQRSFSELMDAAQEGRTLTVERRSQFRYESARAVDRCTEAVDQLFTASGGRSIFVDSDIGRFFRDAHAIRAHFANKPEAPGRNLGGVLLGVDNADLFI